MSKCLRLVRVRRAHAGLDVSLPEELRRFLGRRAAQEYFGGEKTAFPSAYDASEAVGAGDGPIGAFGKWEALAGIGEFAREMAGKVMVDRKLAYPLCDGKKMGPDRFPKVNDVMLAEAMRQLLPIAEFGLRAVKTSDLVPPFRRAETILTMWTAQRRGRLKQLDGPMPESPKFPSDYFIEVDVQDCGQIVPRQCERAPRARKSRVVILMP